MHFVNIRGYKLHTSGVPRFFWGGEEQWPSKILRKLKGLKSQDAHYFPHKFVIFPLIQIS